MNGYLFDTNVLLDLATFDTSWFAWSDYQFRKVSTDSLIRINPIIYAELAPAFDTRAALDTWLDSEFIDRRPLPYAAGWAAAEAFAEYRRRGGPRVKPLPDFYIGAHAQVEKLTLVTRDRRHYQTYFPDVTLVAPMDS